jgi:hypothetical protein
MSDILTPEQYEKLTPLEKHIVYFMSMVLVKLKDIENKLEVR